LKFALERLYFWFFEKDKSVRFLFSPAKVGSDLSKHPLIQQADVIHLHWVNFGFLSLASLQKLFALNKPIVWTLHDMWTFTGGCHHSRDCNNFQEQCGNCTTFLARPSTVDLSHIGWKTKKSMYQDSNLQIVTCSKWLQQKAQSSSVLENISVNAIPNPIDTDLFRPILKKEARQQLNLPTDKFLILFAAAKITAAGRKGFDYFEEALQLLAQQYPDIDIECMVMGIMDEQLTAHFPFVVHNLGNISDVQKMVNVYSAASVFVTPSLEENLPNTIMESLACGTPVVGFNTGGIPEMIDHLHNGYVSAYRSATDLAQGINWVKNHSDYDLLATNARQKATSNYAEAIVAQQYIELYKLVDGITFDKKTV
jgi:glycosyltransferase involved in cell wall biosynthesis